MTRVVNLRKDKYDVYIGRPSIFGNPFEIGKDGTREDVIEKYRKYLYDRINNDEEFRKKILELDSKTLGCFCKPERCHGDIIIEFLDIVMERE